MCYFAQVEFGSKGECLAVWGNLRLSKSVCGVVLVMDASLGNFQAECVCVCVVRS